MGKSKNNYSMGYGFQVCVLLIQTQHHCVILSALLYSNNARINLLNCVKTFGQYCRVTGFMTLIVNDTYCINCNFFSLAELRSFACCYTGVCFYHCVVK